MVSGEKVKVSVLEYLVWKKFRIRFSSRAGSPEVVQELLADLKKAFAQMPDCLYSAGMAQMPDTNFFLDLVNVGGFNSL